ncbi:MAG: hypothetical protein NDJ89_15360 [Oligoflexia bacterium]|nr:hypothetical protein [Oligoflexia bacterium]
MFDINQQEKKPGEYREPESRGELDQPKPYEASGKPEGMSAGGSQHEGRPFERATGPARTGARGTAAMDPETRKEVARKGGLAVSRNRQHMAEIGKKGGLSVSKNKEHMAKIGRKGGAASRGQRSGGT